MGRLTETVKREIWKRDGYRCRECGIAVAGKHGCKPQTHHIVPEGEGGNEDSENLMTLCLPCHSTKESSGHRKLFVEQGPQELPNYIKWSLWDLSLDLLAYAEWMPPLRFPAPQVLGWLKCYRNALDSVIKLTEDSLHDHPTGADFESPVSPDQLDGVLSGVKTGWYSNATQQYLDDELRRARQGT